MNLPEPAAHIRFADGKASAVRRLGRFELLQLLGKSRRCMAWRVRASPSVDDTQHFLVLPRAQPADAAGRERWRQAVQRASRLEHPNLARALEIGVCEGWPYVLYEAHDHTTLSQSMEVQAIGATAACRTLGAVLQGLAFAHDGGVAHRDLQPWLVLQGEAGVVRLLGLEVGYPADAAPQSPKASAAAQRNPVEALALHEQRDAARADVLAMGLLLQWTLSGQPPLGESDLGQLAERLPPAGRDLVRLPWDLALPVPEPLRAIANRSTDRQERQRYRSARGLLRAVDGWLQTEASSGGGPLQLLLDRLHSVGSLPAAPESAAHAARLASMDRQRTHELAEVVLQDLALAFELLRLANGAMVRGQQVAGGAPVLTVRRAIGMLGLDGVRRAALGLRSWPGPLAETAADQLLVLFDAARQAGRLAQALRPPGYDAEVVLLITLLQNLGRLVVAYHLPDEWQQTRRLMQPQPTGTPGEPDDPGMSEQAASCAVFGVDIEAVGAAVARHWGWDETVLHLIRRLPLHTAPRTAEHDDDMLRALASCGNEAVDALQLPASARPAALRHVAQRYERALRIELRDLLVLLRDREAPGFVAAPPLDKAPLHSENRSRDAMA